MTIQDSPDIPGWKKAFTKPYFRGSGSWSVKGTLMSCGVALGGNNKVAMPGDWDFEMEFVVQKMLMTHPYHTLRGRLQSCHEKWTRNEETFPIEHVDIPLGSWRRPESNGPLGVVICFIPSCTHLQLGLSRV